MKGPTQQTLKRLIAKSGDQCAFPKCTQRLVEGDSFVGEIAHIKGAKAGAARHDSDLPPEKVHAYDNLIILCGVHHKVIDDDEEAYTLERVVKMKLDHEQREPPMDESKADAIAQIIVDQTVTTINQTGGIAAHTINAQNLTVAGPLRQRLDDTTIHDLRTNIPVGACVQVVVCVHDANARRTAADLLPLLRQLGYVVDPTIPDALGVPYFRGAQISNESGGYKILVGDCTPLTRRRWVC